jgi:hypothetical protein
MLVLDVLGDVRDGAAVLSAQARPWMRRRAKRMKAAARPIDW